MVRTGHGSRRAAEFADTGRHYRALTSNIDDALTDPRYADGMLYTKLFRSRWAALLWAGGILWTAVDFVGVAPARQSVAANTTDPGAPTDATGMAVDGNNLAILANVMGN